MNILLVDNNDSFTHILRESLLLAGAETVEVIAVQSLDCTKIAEHYSGVVISPGPGTPEDNKLPELVLQLAEKLPVLGICLGLQAICMAFGGNIYNLPHVFHGEKRKITTQPNSTLFKGMGNETTVGLYHSWAAEISTLPDSLSITALSADGIVMALEHKSLPVYGVQFHPESHLTPDGISILKNWLTMLQ